MAKKQQNKVRITLIKSIIGCTKKQRQCVHGLGLNGRINRSVELEDTPMVRGMIQKVFFLLKVEAVA